MKRLCLLLMMLLGSVAIGQVVKSNIGARSISYGNENEESVIPYVTRGLVAMWDGEWNVGFGLHDDGSPVWVDLVEGREMPITLASLSWEQDALVRTGVDGLTYDSGLDFSDPLSERTFEFVISYDADYIDTSSNWYIVRFEELGTWLSFWNRTAFGITLYAGAAQMKHHTSSLHSKATYLLLVLMSHS